MPATLEKVLLNFAVWNRQLMGIAIIIQLLLEAPLRQASARLASSA